MCSRMKIEFIYLPEADWFMDSNKEWNGGDKVIELDQFKAEILTYEAPLMEVRDSLWHCK